MIKIHPYALIFVVVYFAFVLFSNAYLYDDIGKDLDDWWLYVYPVAVLYIGYSFGKGNPSEKTVGNLILVHVACLLLIVPLSCGRLKYQKERYEQQQQIQQQKQKARQQEILKIFNQDKDN